MLVLRGLGDAGTDPAASGGIGGFFSGMWDSITGGGAQAPDPATAPPAAPADPSGSWWGDITNSISSGYDTASANVSASITASQQQQAAADASSAAWQSSAASVLNLFSNALYPKPGAKPSAPVVAAPTPWYSTGVGMLAIAAAAAGGIYYLTKKS